MAARAGLAFAFVFLLAISADADWSVTSSETKKSATAGVEHRRIVVTDENSDEATLDFAIFSRKSARLRIVDNPNAEDELAAVMRRVRGIAGVNGGYFDPQNAPVGLLIADGKSIAPLRKARLLSGVVVAGGGKVQLLRTAEYSARKNVTDAVQCGPFLVDGGKTVPGLNDVRTARRTFVLTAGQDRAALGFSSAVTLKQLGDVLITPRLLADAKIQRALNLDGGSSSAFWFAGERGVVSLPEQKTVRDFVIVTPK